MHCSILVPVLLAGAVSAWLPQERHLAAFNQTARFEQLGKRFGPSPEKGVTKIRGVNFGGWLICEPWMMSNEWNNVMDCVGTASEFDCMRSNYGGDRREAGNNKFEEHWKTWITPDTVQSVHDVGLNTIRIPIGYWSYTDIVDKASEPFADGDRMLPYLDAVVKKASDLGIYVIMDLHGAPGGQQEDAFTGQNNRPAGFFSDYNFGRAEKWLAWMTRRIHTNPAYATVGMIEVLNEPVSTHDPGARYPAPGQVPGLLQKYYPAALKAVRFAEAALNVPDSKKLHVQFMSKRWDAGNPRANAAVAADVHTAFDDHNYIGFALGNDRGNRTKLMRHACRDSRVVDGQTFTLTGEWSMTSDVGTGADKENFFRNFFAAQQQLYEKPGMSGWVYWTWKTELNDPRWTYSDATWRRLVPSNAFDLEQNVYRDVCDGYR
ncbi:hypothetical protein E4U43_005322 [Claviceps pusilla]|uniref:glucan endo-1,6-beta-glucosidase n=1 Tax=Claviceps pusilla TaxID=123648 RepID=A0A9P7SVJ7_9HYPO|nr:hypothetical protein E4U43_005322 [Claviceps pusilla]